MRTPHIEVARINWVIQYVQQYQESLIQGKIRFQQKKTTNIGKPSFKEFSDSNLSDMHPLNNMAIWFNQKEVKFRKVSHEFMRHQSWMQFLWLSLWAHLSQKLRPWELGNINTTKNSCRDTLSSAKWD